MKKINKYILMLLAGCALFSLFSCKTDAEIKKEYVVSYVSRVGNVPAPVRLKSGTLLSEVYLPELSLEHYTFNGWLLETKLLKPDTYKITSDIVLTASWTGEDCLVTFTHTDNISGQVYKKIYENGETITLPQSPYDAMVGLEFKGWLCNGRYYNENSSFVVTGDTVFTAFYAEEGVYTISYYDVCDGVVVTDNKFADSTALTGVANPVSFTKSQNVFISDLQKKGYTFGGWYTDLSCTQSYKAVTFWLAGDVSKDISLYAKWTVNTYTIEFEPNSGTLINHLDPQTSLTVGYEETVTLPECKYALSGFEFVGWSIDSQIYDIEFESGKTVAVSSLCSDNSSSNTIMLYAHWRDAVHPSSPAGFTVTDVDNNSITLSWTNSADSDLAFTRLSYNKKSEAKKTYVDFSVEEYPLNYLCKYTVQNLERGATYNFTITSYDISGNANNYDAACTTIAVPRPKPFIPKLTLKQKSVTELEVSWNAPSAADYPYLQTITLNINDDTSLSYSGQDCYDNNSFTCTITPVTLYKVKLSVTEEEDESGRNNAAQTELYKLFSEPDFNVTGNIQNYSYSNSIGFDIGNLDDIVPDSIKNDLNTSYYAIAECTVLDEQGNADERTKTTRKIDYDNAKDIYIRDNLAPSTTYKIRLYTFIRQFIEGGWYETYSYLLAKEMECTTADRGVFPGYFCYSATEYYKDIQKAGSSLGNPIGVVAFINSYNEAVKVIYINDLEADNATLAKTAVSGLGAGDLQWALPTKDEFERLYEPQTIAAVADSLEKLENYGGSGMQKSSVSQDGKNDGRYITSTAGTESGTVIVFDAEPRAVSSAIQVPADGSDGSFRIRPFAKVLAGAD